MTRLGSLLILAVALLNALPTRGLASDLVFSLTASPSPVIVGGNLTYTYTISHGTPGDSVNVVLTNVLPPSVILHSVVVTNGNWTNDNGVFQYNLDTLASDEVVLVKLIVTPVNMQAISNAAGVYAVDQNGSVIFNKMQYSITPVVAVAGSASMNQPRLFHAMTTLQDGRVLISGGSTSFSPDILASAEIYDPALDLMQPTGDMTVPRSVHSSTLLDDGRVLVAGGNTVDLFDPTNGVFSYLTNLATARESHSATKLADGRVVIAEGSVDATLVEVYDPADGKMSVLGHLTTPRYEHVAAVLPDGKILYAGGASNGLSAEIFDPISKTSSAVADMKTNHVGIHGIGLLDGRVLVLGGENAQLFDPGTKTFSLTTPPTETRSRGKVVRLHDGRVLTIGGGGPHSYLASTDLFNPATQQFVPGPPMSINRDRLAVTLLADGRVFVAGGSDGSYLKSTEILAITLDVDKDGMADGWELSHGFDPSDRNDSLEDADGDEHSNLQEYLAGTDPTNAASNMRILIDQLNATTVRISFTTVIGKRYAVESATNLNGGSWDIVTNNVLGTGVLMQALDSSGTASLGRVYRVRLIP